MKRILTLYCVLGLTSVLRAQTDSDGPPPLPSGPLIQIRAPDFAEWVITKKVGSISDSNSGSNTSPDAPSATATESTQDTVTKTHNVVRVVRLDTRKLPWTIWCHGAQEYMIWPDGKSCAQLTPGQKDLPPNPFYIDFSASDFSGFEWISPRTYTGIKSYQGSKCMVFQTASSLPNDSGVPSTPTKQIAYIDFTSRLPVALQSGGEEYLYKWHAPPQELLSFPSKVQALIDAGIKAQRQMAQKAVRPW